MAKFIAISGPASTGKTQLVTTLHSRDELSDAVFVNDIYTTVWDYLVANKYFNSYTEVNRDSDYLAIYILRLIDSYKNTIEQYRNTDKLVILDGSWVDISVYAMVNMWYTRVIKQVQEDIMKKLHEYDKSLSAVYFTSYDETKNTIRKDRIPCRVSNITQSRPLEIQYYNLAHNYKNSIELPTTDTDEAADFIIGDLRNLGYTS